MIDLARMFVANLHLSVAWERNRIMVMAAFPTLLSQQMAACIDKAELYQRCVHTLASVSDMAWSDAETAFASYRESHPLLTWYDCYCRAIEGAPDWTELLNSRRKP